MADSQGNSTTINIRQQPVKGTGKGNNTNRSKPPKKGRGKRGAAPPATVTIRTVPKKMGKKNKFKRTGTRITRESYPNKMAAEAHVKSLVKRLVGTFDAGADVGEGLRIPRINSRPVAARSLPLSLQIPSADFANNKLQVRAIPDMYRTFAHTVDNGLNAQVTPSSNGLSLENSNVLPVGTKLCLAPDFNATHIIRADPVKLNDNETYHTIVGRNESSGAILSEGAKAYLFEACSVSADPQFKWKGEYQKWGSNISTAKLKVKVVGIDNAQVGRTVLWTLESAAADVTSANVVDLVFPDNDWIAFANFITNSNLAKGILFEFEFTTDDNTAYRNSQSLSLIWANNKPVFTSPTQWKSYSIFDLLGEAGNTLKAEIDNVTKGVVTHFDLRFTDFVADLNRNGTISATQVPAAAAKYFPSDVDQCIKTIDVLGIPEYSWKGQPEKEGLTYVTHFDNPSSWERRPSTYLINKGQDLDDVDIPMMILAANFAAGVSPTPHVIKIVGSINFEWETTSLAFDLKFPPSNFSRFNEAYFQAITLENPFTHNPTHFKDIAKKIENIMKHPLTRYVVKTVAEVGLGAVLAVV